MNATSMATLWVFVSLLIFLGLLMKMGVPKMLTGALDSRAERIRKDLDDARKLREEAQALLAEYQKKRKEAEAEAGDIVAHARRDAAAIVEDARTKSAETIKRRTAMAELKIAQAERDAVAEVRSAAVDIAIEAARRILAEKAGGAAAADLFKESIVAVKSRLN
ncbi:MAG: F0F1 ATP synthase subunit B [Phyllobacteriaceae bacterium]|nr:F0F1 ATP synthase subunit B [Phyllobacteriaceae bacterium]